MKCGHVYAPMSTIKQSLSVVMSDQVETLWVNFISVEWWLGHPPLPPPHLTLPLPLPLILSIMTQALEDLTLTLTIRLDGVCIMC